MSPRLVLVILLSLSLCLPAGSAGAHALAMAVLPSPDDIRGETPSEPGLSSSTESGCHEAKGKHAPAAPVIDEPAPPGPSTCCKTCDCDCSCPQGKAMAIGPAHLASATSLPHPAVRIVARAYPSGDTPLRPPRG